MEWRSLIHRGDPRFIHNLYKILQQNLLLSASCWFFGHFKLLLPYSSFVGFSFLLLLISFHALTCVRQCSCCFNFLFCFYFFVFSLFLHLCTVYILFVGHLAMLSLIGWLVINSSTKPFWFFSFNGFHSVCRCCHSIFSFIFLFVSIIHFFHSLLLVLAGFVSGSSCFCLLNHSLWFIANKCSKFFGKPYEKWIEIFCCTNFFFLFSLSSVIVNLFHFLRQIFDMESFDSIFNQRLMSKIFNQKHCMMLMNGASGAVKKLWR